MGSRSEYSTRPRERISAILDGARRFFSAAEVHRALQDQHANVALSTVYRTLEHLREKGEATTRLDESGEATYMACRPAHHHHHAICNRCGRVEDVDCGAIEQFAETLRTFHGFELDDHRMEFYGRCSACK